MLATPGQLTGHFRRQTLQGGFKESENFGLFSGCDENPWMLYRDGRLSGKWSLNCTST